MKSKKKFQDLLGTATQYSRKRTMLLTGLLSSEAVRASSSTFPKPVLFLYGQLPWSPGPRMAAARKTLAKKIKAGGGHGKKDFSWQRERMRARFKAGQSPVRRHDEETSFDTAKQKI
jgi:hypothetical protein